MPLNYKSLIESLRNIAGNVHNGSAKDAMWVEEDHPREHGRFASKGSGERFSKGDALAVHEALAKANGELLKNSERIRRPSSNPDETPESDYVKSRMKVKHLADIARSFKVGDLIKPSGIGAMHRQMFREADKKDERPEYGPGGAKREDSRTEVRSHPFHQAVVEAYGDIRKEADRQKRPNPLIRQKESEGTLSQNRIREDFYSARGEKPPKIPSPVKGHKEIETRVRQLGISDPSVGHGYLNIARGDRAKQREIQRRLAENGISSRGGLNGGIKLFNFGR